MARRQSRFADAQLRTGAFRLSAEYAAELTGYVNNADFIGSERSIRSRDSRLYPYLTTEARDEHQADPEQQCRGQREAVVLVEVQLGEHVGQRDAEKSARREGQRGGGKLS